MWRPDRASPGKYHDEVINLMRFGPPSHHGATAGLEGATHTVEVLDEKCS